MRTIDRQLVDAIRRRKAGTIARNLRTEVMGTGCLRVLLHGHAIAIVTYSGGEVDSVSIGQCGWVTATTHARINAVLSGFAPGWRTFRKQGEGFVSGPDGVQPMGHMGRTVVHLGATLQAAA